MKNYVTFTKNKPSRYLNRFPGRVSKACKSLDDAIKSANKKGTVLITDRKDADTLQQLIDERVSFVHATKEGINHMAIRVAAAAVAARTEIRKQAVAEATNTRIANGSATGTQLPHVKKLAMASEGFKKANKASGKARGKLADAHIETFAARMEFWLKQGFNPGEVAVRLNDEGFTTRRGFPHSYTSVYKALKRLKGDDFDLSSVG